MKINKIILSFISAIAILLSTSVVSFAKVVGDKIVLGAAISLTSKYSSNGVHTQNGYNLAVERVNSMGGVKVVGKTYKFEIIYYDDESNPKRAAQFSEDQNGNPQISYIDQFPEPKNMSQGNFLQKLSDCLEESKNKVITKLPVGSAIVAKNYFWLHGGRLFKKNKELSRELLRIRGSFFKI